MNDALRMSPSVTTISSITARPRPCAMPPSIWPTTESGLSARPTSCAVAIWMTRTRPSSTSTSTTARWATNANATWHAPWPLLVELFGGAVPVGHGLLELLAGGRVGDRDRARRPRCRRRRCPRSPIAPGRHPCLRRHARTGARAPPGTPCRSRRRTSTSGAMPRSNRPTRSRCRPARARPRRRRGSSRAICAAIVTKPCPTSAVASLSETAPSASRQRAVAESSNPSEYMRFLIASA